VCRQTDRGRTIRLRFERGPEFGTGSGDRIKAVEVNTSLQNGGDFSLLTIMRGSAPLLKIDSRGEHYVR
jgi:hypothetical protein